MSEMDRVISGLDKLYDSINGISNELGRASAQREAMAKTLDEVRSHAKMTNGRVTALEAFKIKAIAYITVIGIIVSGLFQVAQLMM